MRVNGGSELARMQMLQRQAIATRNRLDVAAKELTTNLKANRFEASGGNLTRLFALERVARPQRGVQPDDLADRASAGDHAGELRPDADAGRATSRST